MLKDLFLKSCSILNKNKQFNFDLTSNMFAIITKSHVKRDAKDVHKKNKSHGTRRMQVCLSNFSKLLAVSYLTTKMY